ncbi:hypothetical protein GP486_005664 [Trichoglossum hirsutum]|uniref:DNA endonuclease activator Ctp1 C-terminal domain-containing protein n=1 Tax=Trichoglossum hirsutum TaxID=265104 RepID=A0A9P8L8S2_9PEZI|nr:hypothetical protein GP486_005664 [Trichoglossum hirsutum]
MEEAYQKHRTKLFNAFSRECNLFERDLREELVKRDAVFTREKETLLEELRVLRNQELKVDGHECETKNVELDHEAACRSSQHSPLHRSKKEVKDEPMPGANGTDMLAELGSDSASQLCRENDELKIQLNDISRRYNVLASAHHALLVKYRKERETVRAWSNYIEIFKQRRRRSKLTISANPSDDELARSIFPSGTSASDSWTPYSGSPKVSSSPPPLGRTVRSPSSGRGGRRTGLNPVQTGVSAPNDSIKGVGGVGVFIGATDPGDGATIEHEYSSTDALRESFRHQADRSPGFDPPIPKRSRQQLRVKTKIQRSSETQVGGYDSAETTDGEVERQDALPSPNMTAVGRSHHSPKAIPKEHESPPGTPVILSEHRLKRKAISHYGSAAKPIRIKSEHGSSSPAGLVGIRDHCDVPESLDLDEVGEKVDTPRKRKRLSVFLESQHHHTDSLLDEPDLGLLSHPFQPSAEFLRRVKSDRPDPQADGKTVLHPGEPGGGSEQQAEKATPKEDIVSRAVGELDGADEQKHLSNLKPKANPRASVLRPGNTNIRLPHSTRGSKLINSCSKPEEELEKTMANAHFLVEDGEMLLGSTQGERTVATADDARKGVGQTTNERGSRFQRLAALMDTRSPSKPVLSPGEHRNKDNRQGRGGALICDMQAQRNVTIQGNDKLDPGQDHVVVPEQDQAPTSSRETNSKARIEQMPRSVGLSDPNYRRPGDSGSKRKQRPEPTSLIAARDSGRLRDRPLHSLTLGDFKINPNYTKGSEFAFVETVRNREQRKCLPGCVRPSCCGGTFRKALELGGIPTPAPSNIKLLWNSPQEPEDEEQRLLEDYVGDERHLLDGISPDARRELVIQARTKQFADKYGRHRQAFERRTTPPGFWRTDMPTSQEFEQDREEARKIELSLIEERYREARRGGKGKWIFRDE